MTVGYKFISIYLHRSGNENPKQFKTFNLLLLRTIVQCNILASNRIEVEVTNVKSKRL